MALCGEYAILHSSVLIHQNDTLMTVPAAYSCVTDEETNSLAFRP